MNDIKEPETKRRVTSKDFDAVAEYISTTLEKRKKDRSHREQIWDDIDRQIEMRPLKRNYVKKGADTAWMSDLELPWQAEALEVLCADSRRTLFPDDRNFFSAHVAMIDSEMRNLELSSLISGDENDVPTRVTQENLDYLVEGVHNHFHDMYDFRGAWDALNVSAFKRGTMIGRAKLVDIEKFTHDFRGTYKNKKKIPVLVPMDVKNVYLDDTKAAITFGNTMTQGSVIFTYFQHIDDLRMAAMSGSKDPDNMDGGWIPKNLNGLEGGENQMVEMVEYEGDIIIPRSRGSMFFPNVVVTAACGTDGKGKAVNKIVRWRFSPFPFRSYFVHGYHHDDPTTPYASSPLMKGRPIQRAGTEMFNRLIDAGVLSLEPPVQYNKDDPFMAKEGGPQIYPRAKWATTDPVSTVEIGDIAKLQNAYIEMVRQYQEVTGISSPRLGAQTKSHQTAFAVDAEIQRGSVRTVDYVRSVMYGPMRTWLSMEYQMAKKALKDEEQVYIPEYGGYVNIKGDLLPSTVTYDVHGSGGPLEEQEKAQKKMAAIQMAAQIEQLAVQSGAEPLNWDAIRRDILREGFTDVDKYTERVNAGIDGVSQAITSELPVSENPETPTGQQDELVAMATGLVR